MNDDQNLENAFILAYLGMANEALALVNKSNDFQSESYAFSIAKIQESLGLYDDAFSIYEKISHSKISAPIRAWAFSYKADILLNEGQLIEALNEVNEALKIDPDNKFIQNQAKMIEEELNDGSGKFLALSIMAFLSRKSKQK